MELVYMDEVFRQTCHSRWRKWCQGLVASLADRQYSPQAVKISAVALVDYRCSQHVGGFHGRVPQGQSG
jgi:hypothetical protein